VEDKTNRSFDDNYRAFCYDREVQMGIQIADLSQKTSKEQKVQIELHTRVLIADDQRPVREGLRSVLALLSQVTVVGEAVDGQDAVHLVAERHPDVVLMDIQMPVMDGLEATRRIKSQWPWVRVIALTMYARYRAKALDAGADVFLIKGCVSETLQEAILAQYSESHYPARWR
jgi:DNA-binding NarL/FixJ family response regulator